MKEGGKGEREGGEGRRERGGRVREGGKGCVCEEMCMLEVATEEHKSCYRRTQTLLLLLGVQ